jgi:hypothetical protein
MCFKRPKAAPRMRPNPDVARSGFITRGTPKSQGVFCQIGSYETASSTAAEQTVAPDRGRITAFHASRSPQWPRQVNFIVARLRTRGLCLKSGSDRCLVLPNA